MFPLYSNDLFGYATAMALATLFGLGFGFVLERSGFGRASILVSQFYGTDNRVFKVMFTAIATATAGMGLLSGVGVLDPTGLTIPESFWAPQLVGGLLLGVGFAISGYCPGTALVAAGSGNRDGWFSILGTMLGGVAFAVAWPWIEGFYLSTAMGPLTLPELLGLPWAAVAAGVVAMALAFFLLAEKGEVYFSRRAGMAAPPASASQRNRVFGAMGGLVAFGLATMALPSTAVQSPSVADSPTPSPASIDALALAEQLVIDPSAMWLVDLRDTADCERARIPGALCLPAGDADAALLSTLPPTRDLVLYGQGTLSTLPASAAAREGRVLVLDDGFAGFQATILTAPTPPALATRQAVADYQHRAALHGQLTGSSAAAAPVVAAPVTVTRAAKKGGGC